jgi:hypothetical protein
MLSEGAPVFLGEPRLPRIHNTGAFQRNVGVEYRTGYHTWPWITPTACPSSASA